MKLRDFQAGRAFRMTHGVLLTVLATGACRSEAPPASPAQSGDTIAPVAASAALPSATANASQVASASPAPTEVVKPAIRYCGSGPHATPLSGELKATKIPNTEPTALDSQDTGFHLYEGAVWLNDGLYFSDFKTTPGFPSRIMRYEPGKALRVAVEDSGSNGLGLDAAGSQLVAARHKSKSVMVLDAAGKFVHEVAKHFEGKPFLSPNDLVFRSDGNLYFTDPDFQAGEQKDQATTNVYRVSPSGVVTVVDSSIKNPNGIALSLDEATLYVAGNLEKGYLKSYPVAADGAVAEGKVLLADVTVPDGLTVDCAGNIYVTEHTSKRIRVVSPAGKELGQITGLEHNVTNVAFGGPEGKTLYITTTGALYQLELPVVGLPY